MSKSSLAREKKDERIDWAAEVVFMILNENKKQCMPKMTIWKRAEKSVVDIKKKHGVYVKPSLTYKDKTYDIKEPDYQFIKANWSDIVLYIAEKYKKYPVYQNGKGNGYKLGSFNEFVENHRRYFYVNKGIARKSNIRADLINSRGGEAQYINVKLQIASGE